MIINLTEDELLHIRNAIIIDGKAAIQLQIKNIYTEEEEERDLTIDFSIIKKLDKAIEGLKNGNRKKE